ncbi:MAG TPA: hybrid sensor histidine kinase/response regulator, partial [Vicinamibacterales bacterium]|nr:hybrid sensor histidine kinase/response regulator [Vicinamibacterales bacterium]
GLIFGKLHENEPRPGMLRLAVRDFGAGMDAPTVKRLFAPFEQPRAPIGGQAGLGLGLTIARSIVELHGGAIWASSDGLGRGSVFEVELRTTAPDESALPLRGELSFDARPHGSARILLVENHQDTAFMLVEGLKQRGYDATSVCSLHDGLARLEEGWDVILSDIGLDDGSGLDIARRCRQSGVTPAHLIAVSGYGTDADRQASRDAGFDHHLVKPIDLDALLELIESGDTVATRA